MVAASSAMRFTTATYSSRTHGRRRERETVTIMASSIRAACCGFTCRRSNVCFWSVARTGPMPAMSCGSACGRLDRRHIVVGQAEMMADFVHQDVGDDLAQRLVVLGSVVQHWTSIY